MKNPGVYILQSLKNNRYYIGSTDNPNQRLYGHDKGWVKTTKNIRPLNLMVFISCSTLTKAKSAEYRLKKYKRKDILKKVIKDKIFPWDYSGM